MLCDEPVSMGFVLPEDVQFGHVNDGVVIRAFYQ